MQDTPVSILLFAWYAARGLLGIRILQFVHDGEPKVGQSEAERNVLISVLSFGKSIAMWLYFVWLT